MPASHGDLAWPLERTRRLHGSATAVIDDGREVSYHALADRVSRFGGALDSLGITRGGRVGVLAANSNLLRRWGAG